MKTLLAIALLVAAVFCPASTLAQTNTTSSDIVSLAWNANIESDLGGYRVFLTQNTNGWTHVKNTALNSAQVTLPAPGRWYFMVTATNLAGLESEPSNIVEYTTPTGPAKPSTFRLVSASVVRASTVTVVSNLVYLP